MMHLDLAIKAGITMIGLNTTDTLYLYDYIEWLTGSPPGFWKNGQKQLKKNSVYLYIESTPLVSTQEVYTRFYEDDSILLVVNQAPHDLILPTGTLVLEPKYVLSVLEEQMDSTRALENTWTLGGLTKKEILDVLRLTEARTGGLDPAEVQTTRQSYTPPTKGLEAVRTDSDGYSPCKSLQSFAESERMFILGDIDTKLRPRGLLAYGPPGTGKSAGAKYLASEWGVPLFRLSAGVQDMYVGQSEANLEAALRQIESMAPVVFLLDEVEKLFSGGGDSGVTQKMLGTILWWMQEHESQVLTYMTCNDISKVPPELYREGRVDKSIMFHELQIEKTGTFITRVLKQYGYKKEQRAKIKNTVNRELGEYAVQYETDKIPQAAMCELIKQSVKEYIRGSKNKQ